MANFDAILQGLHTNSNITDSEGSTPVLVTSRRAFEVPSDYDTVLGYTGDVNSQIITFQLPRLHEKHDLSVCQFKKLKWQNLASGTEGVSTLESVTAQTDTWTATWAVPPEAMTMAGQLEIAISIYDKKDGLIAFSWNTPAFRGFSVGNTANQIADIDDKINDNLPASNEILVVNTETRQIEAPVNWNPVVASYGDIGLSKVFFEINQHIRGLDITKDDVKIYVGVAFISDTVEYYEVVPAGADKKDYVKQMFKSETNQKANKVLIIWDVPESVTNNNQAYAGNFSISLKIQTEDAEQKPIKRWTTAQFNKVTIGQSVLLNDMISLIARDEELVGRVVEEIVDQSLDESVGELVDEKIDNYIDNTYFVTDNNDN